MSLTLVLAHGYELSLGSGDETSELVLFLFKCIGVLINATSRAAKTLKKEKAPLGTKIMNYRKSPYAGLSGNCVVLQIMPWLKL